LLIDDLTTPLGRQRAKRRRYRLPFSATQALAVVLGLFLAGFVGFAIFGDNPFGGEPAVRVAIPPAQVQTPAATAADASKAATPQAAVVAKPVDPAGQKTITIIDGSSGARRDVTVPNADDGTQAPAAGPSAGAPAAAVDSKLLEASRYGMVPIIAADGTKPSKAYATGSDAQRARAATVPNVSIVIVGLGIGSAKTADAVIKLPGAITLAFTPYGADGAKLVERARAQGHEVLLQLPMEPFDYPDNDPGPQTLLTTLSTEQNIDRMHWHMSRFQGYVGIANFMGARFVTSEKALEPIMQQAAKRGLIFLDDNSASRSVTAQLADAQTVPYAKSDATIDSIPTASEIDRALAGLESLARQRGAAIGIASALPVSIDRIAAWSKSLENRGIALVPLTMAIAKSKSR
jgi:polysaccharide deacetylase 2 family uncharacterized protein YibQ